MVPDIHWTTAAALGGLLLLLAVAAVGPLSVADQRDTITFYHLSPDAGSTTDSLQQTLQQKYPGTFSDTARLGRYTFDVSNLFNENDACTFESVVKRDGQVIDDYDINNQIRQGFNSRSGDRTKSYGELEVTHGATIYTDPYVYRGDFFGMTSCDGTFSKYRLPVDTQAIDANIDVPEEAVAGDSVTATVEVTNTWRPLQANLTTELCVDTTFCTTKERTAVELPRGRTTVEIPYEIERAGQLSVDLQGPIGLDLDHYPVDGVSVDCDQDGQMDDAARCETITVGTVTGSGVTTVKSTSAAIFDPDLMVQAVKLKWAQVTAWLTTRV